MAGVATRLRAARGNSCVVVLQRADAEPLLAQSPDRAAAAPPVSVVMHGTSCSVAARRTVRSSKNESRPSGVLMTRLTLRFDDLFANAAPKLGRPICHLAYRYVKYMS